jgi:hypothetical protein
MLAAITTAGNAANVNVKRSDLRHARSSEPLTNSSSRMHRATNHYSHSSPQIVTTWPGVLFDEPDPDEAMTGTFGYILDRSLPFIVYQGQRSKKPYPFATVYRRFYYPSRPLDCSNNI